MPACRRCNASKFTFTPAEWELWKQGKLKRGRNRAQIVPVYSARERREALEPWVFRDGWRRWVARPVSADLVVQAIEKLEAAETLDRQRSIARRILRFAFPWRASFIWVGDPVRLITSLPQAQWRETVRSFFDWALGRTPVHPAPPTPSSTSSSSGTTAGPSVAAPAFPSS